MLNVVLVGFGWWGQHVARRLVDHPMFRIAAVVEPSEALHAQIQAMGLAVETDFDSAITREGVEAVILTSPVRVFSVTGVISWSNAPLS